MLLLPTMGSSGLAWLNLDHFSSLVDDSAIGSDKQSSAIHNNSFYTHLRDREDIIAGELLICFKDDVSFSFFYDHKQRIDTNIDSINTLNEKFKVKRIEPIFTQKIAPFASSVYRFVLSEGSDISSVLKEYEKNPCVDYVQPNYRLVLHLIPSDPFFHSYGSWDQQYDDLWGLKKIQCEEAWEQTTGSNDVIVAVLDSGIDYNHPDIRDNLWVNDDEILGNDIDDDADGFIDNKYGPDFAYGDSDPLDRHGHGTHCAGIIAAVGNNNLGIVGVNWKAKIMPVKTFNDLGIGSSHSIAQAIYWAADNGADIISNSWGSHNRNPSNPVIENAVEYATDKGCIVVFSAGNSNDDIRYYSPQNMDETITVSATDVLDKKSHFSNWGETIDCSAPGVDILSLRAHQTDMYGDQTHIVNDLFYRASGTSMACSFVSGVCSLLVSHDPDVTIQQIKDRFVDMIDHIWSPLPIGGRINAFKSVLLTKVSAHILSPVMDTDLNGSVDIIGTATGDEFIRYIVDVRRCNESSQWITIKESLVKKQKSTLASVTTSDFDDGTYFFRLRVFFDMGVLIDTVQGVINNEFNFYDVSADGGDEFSSIQTAIDQAGSHDRIVVKQGLYHENIVIDRPLQLIGEAGSMTVIENDQPYDIVRIYADDVNLSGFTFRNQYAHNSGYGIVLWQVKKNVIFGNQWSNIGATSAFSNIKSAVFLYNATENVIQANTFIDNTGNGIELFSSSQNVLSGNSFDDNRIGIILLDSSDGNLIGGNDLVRCSDTGLKLFFSSENMIRFNIVKENELGVFIDEDSVDNQISQNNFFENIVHAWDVGSDFWHNSSVMKGNYWDDFEKKFPNATDENDDEIWDGSYVINGSDNADDYPLKRPLSLLSPDKPRIVNRAEIRKIPVGEPVIFFFQGEDPQGQRLCYYIDWGNGEIDNDRIFYDSGEIVDINYSFVQKGSYHISVRTMNEDGRVSRWSDPLLVDVPKQKSMHFSMLDVLSMYVCRYLHLFSFFC